MIGQVLRVEWEDSANFAGWLRPAEVEEFGKDPFIATSVGVEVFRDDKGLVLAGSTNKEGWHASVQRIPVPMIRKESVLVDPPGIPD